MRGLRKRDPFAEPHQNLTRLLITAAALLILVTITSFLGSWWWLFDLAAHFRIQLATASFVVLVAALILRSCIPIGMGVVALLANLVPLASYWPSVGRAYGALEPDLRVMTLNLHGSETNPESFGALVNAEDPDIILLTELPEDRHRFLAPVGIRYPYIIDSFRGSPFDTVLLSRWKPEAWSVDRSVAPFLPVLTAQLCSQRDERRCLTIVGLHAARPFGNGARLQQAQLRLASDAVKAASKKNVVVMGDLNLTPWSATFRGFTQDAGLSAHPHQRGLETTWLSRFPLFGLAIDHVLTSPDIQLIESEIGGDVGSDHWPVIATITLDPQP